MAGGMTWYEPSELERFANQALGAAGAPADLAALTARHLIAANLAGHDSHGVLRVPSYVELVDRGQLRPAARPVTLRETSTTAVLDGAHGFGYTTMDAACRLGAAKARAHGLAAVAIRNCGHIGRVGGWVEALAQDGLIGQLTVGSLGPGSGAAAPFGGAARALGTNPWAIGIPASDGAPVVLDFATTAVAEGKLRVARAKRAALPAGWIVGPGGQPSTDVEDFYRGGMLLPFGGHKGYALSVVAALLGALSADAAAEEGRASGVFLHVLDPGAFGDGAAYARRVAAAARTLRQTPPVAGGGPVLAPGDPERASRWLRAEAIPLAAGTIEQFAEVASRFALTMPQPLRRHLRLGAYLVEEFGLSAARLREAMARQEAGGADRPRLGDLLLSMGALDAASLDAALRRQREDDARLAR